MRRFALLAASHRLPWLPRPPDLRVRSIPTRSHCRTAGCRRSIATAPDGTFYSGSRANGAVYAGACAPVKEPFSFRAGGPRGRRGGLRP